MKFPWFVVGLGLLSVGQSACSSQAPTAADAAETACLAVPRSVAEGESVDVAAVCSCERQIAKSDSDYAHYVAILTRNGGAVGSDEIASRDEFKALLDAWDDDLGTSPEARSVSAFAPDTAFQRFVQLQTESTLACGSGGRSERNALFNSMVNDAHFDREELLQAMRNRGQDVTDLETAAATTN